MTTGRVGRNDPCPCRSGRKYKQCCLPGAASAASGSTPGATRASAAVAARRPVTTSKARGAGGNAGRSSLAGAAARDPLVEASEHHRAGRHQFAAPLFELALRQRPNHVPAILGLAHSRGQLGDTVAAIDLLRRAIKLDPKNSAAHMMLGNYLFRDGFADEALLHVRRSIETDKTNAMAYGVLAHFLERLHQVDEAIEVARAGVEQAPGDLDLQTLLGRLYRRAGRLEEAKSQLEPIIKEAGEAPPRLRKAAHELGVVLDRLGDSDRAFAAFIKSGKAAFRMPEAQRIDRAWAFRIIEHYRNAITPERLREAAAEDFSSERPAPVFLVGFPRSGTTLVEQILAAHPAVITSDENPLIRMTSHEGTRRFGGTTDGSVNPAALDRNAIAELRRYYWECAEAKTPAPIGDQTFIDKMPINLVELGLVNILFPDAKIIVVTRDPRDVCLSCFMQNFDFNAAMVQFLTLEGTVKYYDAVMSWWARVLRPMLTMKIFETRYESLVANAESGARELIDFLGLAWSDDVLRFHEIARDRAIGTPSYIAVVRPANTKSIGRWRGYERHLKSSLPILEPHIRALGYE